MKTTVGLCRALNLIEDIGWVKGRSVKYEAGKPAAYCLTGALDKVYGGQYSIPWNVWSMMGFETRGDAINYNDADSRRKSHIIRKLEKGIETALECGV